MSSQNVKIENATKIYGNFKACDHISLDIKGGGILRFLARLDVEKQLFCV